MNIKSLVTAVGLTLALSLGVITTSAIAAPAYHLAANIAFEPHKTVSNVVLAGNNKDVTNEEEDIQKIINNAN